MSFHEDAIAQALESIKQQEQHNLDALPDAKDMLCYVKGIVSGERGETGEKEKRLGAA